MKDFFNNNYGYLIIIFFISCLVACGKNQGQALTDKIIKDSLYKETLNCDSLIDAFIVSQKHYDRYNRFRECDIKLDSMLHGFDVDMGQDTYDSATLAQKMKLSFHDFIDDEDLCILAKIYKYAYPKYYSIPDKKVRKFSEGLVFCTQNKKVKLIRLKWVTENPKIFIELYKLKGLKSLNIQTLGMSDNIDIDTAKLKHLEFLEVNSTVLIWKYPIKQPF